MERTLVIVKPDAVHRGLIGEVMGRLERKGLQISAMKMAWLTEEILEEHYRHHLDKPFFPRLKHFMMSAPVVLMVVEGLEAVAVVRHLCGPTNAREAPAGSIRGDLGVSQKRNLIHASDTEDTAREEIARFFRPEEICQYQRADWEIVYALDERG